MSRDDNLSIVQDGVPHTLVAPVIHVIRSDKQAYLSKLDVLLEDIILLFAQSNGRSKKPDDLMPNCMISIVISMTFYLSYLMCWASLQLCFDAENCAI